EADLMPRRRNDSRLRRLMSREHRRQLQSQLLMTREDGADLDEGAHRSDHTIQRAHQVDGGKEELDAHAKAIMRVNKEQVTERGQENDLRRIRRDGVGKRGAGSTLQERRLCEADIVRQIVRSAVTV